MVSVKGLASGLFGGRSLMALPAALALAFILLAAAPASWFLQIHSIRIVQTDDGRVAVIQARTVWPGKALRVTWAAQIDRLSLSDAGHKTGATVCAGAGQSTIRDDDFEIVKMPLADWVGDPSCDLARGVPHVAHASWAFTVLGLTKTATHRSAAFVQHDPEVALND